jgi:hypothetical protein
MKSKGHPESAVKDLLRPDKALEEGKGLTVFDGKTKPATVYRLESTEDVVNMYRCKGVPLPAHWDIRSKKGVALV